MGSRLLPCTGGEMIRASDPALSSRRAIFRIKSQSCWVTTQLDVQISISSIEPTRLLYNSISVTPSIHLPVSRPFVRQSCAERPLNLIFVPNADLIGSYRPYLGHRRRCRNIVAAIGTSPVPILSRKVSHVPDFHLSAMATTSKGQEAEVSPVDDAHQSLGR